MNWTAEQILSLSPDASSTKAGQSLAAERHWRGLGCDQRAAWGLCQGSGKEPYRTQIDLSEPAFRCSCPSRKFPCKHGLGLFLLLAAQSKLFKEAEQPPWVGEWLGSRVDRAEKRAEKQARAIEERGVDAVAQSKRAERREERVKSGLQELELWLRDLVRQGLAAAQTAPQQFWERPASRLVDDQAPGLARMVREMAGAAQSGEGWQSRLFERASLLYLLIEGYKRLGSLPLETQARIRSVIGWTENQDELLQTSGVHDRWVILGRRIVEEDRLKTQRTWMIGRETKRPALVLHFANGSQPLDVSFVPGTEFDAELVFFPGAYPLRALVKERKSEAALSIDTPGETGIACAFQAYAAALGQNPWIDLVPMALKGVTPVFRSDDRERWLLRDSSGVAAPLAFQFPGGWQLASISGGRPITIFGEWDGDHLWPLSIQSEGRFLNLS
jgi:hypothetical protein